jgi:two-component system response regulator RegX3
LIITRNDGRKEMMPDDMDRILLIHPDPKATDELTFLLQHSGFQVPTAVDADQALAEISRTEPDVIVMAEAIARINGDEPCVQIRQRCQAPIIILGQDEHESAGIQFLDSGADTYIPSPLNPRLLLVWVRSLLRRRKGKFKEHERS